MINLEVTTPQLKLVKELADATVSRDIKIAERLISKNFIIRTFPKAVGLPDLTIEEYVQKYAQIFSVLAKIEITFHEVIEAPGKVVIHHSTVTTTADGTVFDQYGVAIFTFVCEGEELRILECKDFSNPEQRGAFYSEVARILDRGKTAA